MKIDIFNEIHWLNFRKLPEINPLSLNEQTKKYNQYISELTYQRNVYLHWLEGHKKGDKKKTLQNVGFLLQEDLFNIQQEDGNNIFITAYA
tara:strand:- start:485 stop:757 length:273 start_codon:yes stop_codon:yes gene_type:complete